MHAAAMRFCERYAPTVGGVALDVGGREINGNARGFWPAMTWTVLDLEPGDLGLRDVRFIRADASTWLPDQSYDLVLSTELLEHTASWRACVATMVAAPPPGGELVVTCAGPRRQPHPMDGTHEWADGEHYANISPGDLAAALAGLGLPADVALVGTDVQAHAVAP